MDENLLWTTNMEGAGRPSQLDEEEQLTKENSWLSVTTCEAGEYAVSALDIGMYYW